MYRFTTFLIFALSWLTAISGCQHGDSAATSLLSGNLISAASAVGNGNGEAANGEGPVNVIVRCQPVGTSNLQTVFVAEDPTTLALTASLDITLNGQNRTVAPFSVTRTNTSTETTYQSAPFLLKLSLPVTRADGLYDSQLQAIVDGNQVNAQLLCGVIPLGGISQ